MGHFYRRNYEEKFQEMPVTKIDKISKALGVISDFTVSIKHCHSTSSLSAAEQHVNHFLWNTDIYQPHSFINNTRFSLFGNNLLLQKKISVAPDWRRAVRGSMGHLISEYCNWNWKAHVVRILEYDIKVIFLIYRSKNYWVGYDVNKGHPSTTARNWLRNWSEEQWNGVTA